MQEFKEAFTKKLYDFDFWKLSYHGLDTGSKVNKFVMDIADLAVQVLRDIAPKSAGEAAKACHENSHNDLIAESQALIDNEQIITLAIMRDREERKSDAT